MSKFFIIYLFSLVGGETGTVLSIENYDYSIHQFYMQHPKKQWVRADSSKRENMYVDFINRELCVLEAKNIGLESDPVLAIKIRDLLLQILINESYEQIIATPLINPDDLIESRKFARTELSLSHILISHSGAYLANPPERSLDEALLLAQNIKSLFVNGEPFEDLAVKYSEDPAVVRNSGFLSWVPWGSTVPSFQSAAFAQDVGVLSDPVLTSFGYHLILVLDKRPSDYQYMSDEEYENLIINLSKGAIRNKLRDAAMSYDSLQIESYGVLFNHHSILKIIQAYGANQKEGGFNVGGVSSSADLLESITDAGVVCVYDGRGFGALWFANKIGRIPVSKQPSLDTENKITSLFKTIILQDIAVKKALDIGVRDSYAYRQRKNDVISGLLYNAFLKYLVNSAPKPDTIDVREYYNENLTKKYMGPGSLVVREIRVSSRKLADSLFSLVSVDADFDLLAKKYSIYNPDDGGLSGTFTQNKDRARYDAAVNLDLGQISPVLSKPWIRN